MMFHGRCIAFILLLSLPPLGCGILYTGEHMLVKKLDTILLTANDLPTMEVDPTMNHRRRGVVKQPPVADGFEQSWNGTRPEEHIYVRYWLFQTVTDAQKAADEWQGYIAAIPYLPEPNPEDVIGDATWRPENGASIWFVKNNVIVYITARRPQVNQLPLTRAVARKIEAKIEAVLPKSEKTSREPLQ